MLLLLLLLCSSLTNPFSLLRARKVDFGWGGEGGREGIEREGGELEEVGEGGF